MNLNKLELALPNFSKDAICLIYHLEIPLLEVVTGPRCTKISPKRTWRRDSPAGLPRSLDASGEIQPVAVLLRVAG